MVWHPDKDFRVEPNELYHRHKVTPYQNELLRGVVQSTFLRGRLIYNRGEPTAEPAGLLVKGSGGNFLSPI